MKSISVQNISNYIEHVMKLRDEMAAVQAGFNSSMWFFRGQKSDRWSVVPSIFRGDGLSIEYNIIGDAIRRNPFEFRSMTEFETLTKLQHYGLGTRLLDVTLNPLVALFFATEPHIEYSRGGNGQYAQKKCDGIVYYGYKPWHTITELSTIIASAIPFVSFEKGMTVEEFLTELLDNHMLSSKQKEYLSANNYRSFIDYIQKSSFIRSDQSNERLVRQSGAFLLPTSLNIVGDDEDIGLRRVEKSKCELDNMFFGAIHIPENRKEQIRNELDFFNINESTMLPELEHQMTYIQKSSRMTPGVIPDLKIMPSSISNNDDFIVTDDEPNVRKILEDNLASLEGASFAEILNDVSKATTLIDWKRKKSIQTQIHSSITIRLKHFYSPEKANAIANAILAQLLAPSKEYIV